MKYDNYVSTYKPNEITIDNIHYDKNSDSFAFRFYKGDYRVRVDLNIYDEVYDYITVQEYRYCNEYDEYAYETVGFTRELMRDIQTLIEEIRDLVIKTECL
jgi:hypothetical protein